MPASSKTDVLLPKAKPIRNGDKASVITYSRRKKSYCTDVTAAREEQNEYM